MENEDNNYSHDESDQTYCRKLKSKSKDFAYNTSAHGIPKIGKSRNCCPIRSGWTILYLICLLFLCFSIYNIVQKYMQYPKSVHQNEFYGESLPFPGVTICNLNPSKRSAREFIQKCTFKGKSCDIGKDFRTTADAVAGNCFTFIAGTVAVDAGPANGLRIVANVNTSEYLPTTEVKGIRVTVHWRGVTPFPDVYGHSAPTGFLSTFRIRLKDSRKLAAPYGDCITDTEDDIYPTYTLEGCRRSCIQQQVLDECKCGDPQFPVPKDQHHCKEYNQSEKNCLDQVTQKLSSETSKCRCKRPCRLVEYPLTYSAVVWPADSFKIETTSCNGTQEECIQSYRKGMAAVELFYGDTTVEFTEEYATYDLYSLLTDIAIQFIIWVGISIFTLCEFFIFGVDVLLMTLGYPCQKNK